jgi:hypothetical protein
VSIIGKNYISYRKKVFERIFEILYTYYLVEEPISTSASYFIFNLDNPELKKWVLVIKKIIIPASFLEVSSPAHRFVGFENYVM